MENKSQRLEDEQAKQSKTHYRTSRFFCVNGEWFFSTREGTQIGPYSTKYEAEAGSERYIEHMKKTQNQGEEYALKVAKEGNWKFNHYC